jgi:hypothetical protein
MFSDYQVVSIKNTLLFSRCTYSWMSQPTFLGGGGLVTCKNAIELNHHGGHRCHTAAMGPQPGQQIIQQSTSMLCGRSTSLKLEQIMYSLLVIILLMHVASTTTMQGRLPPLRRRHPLYPAAKHRRNSFSNWCLLSYAVKVINK